MTINCIAIDDEPLALDIIKDYCSKIPFLNLIKTFYNPVDSIDYIAKNKVDLLFLDIQMDKLTGIQFLNALKQKPLTIFTTAYDKYAIKGFELDIVDYLLKPISFERFVKAVDKAFDKVNIQSNIKSETKEIYITNPSDDFIFVKTEYRFEKIQLSDILYIEGMSDYLRIVTPTKRIMTLLNFKKAEDILPQNKFIRVHKSFIVAIDKIENIERNRIKIADQLIPISETYKKNFFEFLDKKKMT
ncbi:MAG: LytTR family DNA-binding domain-containing protein [Bacteroidales bacterium]|jgi:DNA-binding LytR/AlgR family response regulator